MTEKELIAKIRELRQIKPRKDWVVLTKSQILGEELTYRDRVSVSFFPVWKPALATVTVFGILFGVFTLTQNSLPGDLLYPIKKITEKSQAVFVSEEEKPKVQLELANKRLEELTKIAETNQVKKLAPAINESQVSISEATKNLVKLKKADKEILDKVTDLTENLKNIETILATKIGSEEDEKTLNDWMKEQVEREIKDLEGRSLTDEQKEILIKAKEDFEAGNYSEALIKIFNLSQK